MLNTRSWAQIEKLRGEGRTFREDGRRPSSGSPRYLERVRDYPVLAQVEPGDMRALPAAPPEQAEPFADVLRDLDGVLMPGITHWQSPRYFAYFATTASEPGILAELLTAGLNQVGILWRTSPALQELEEVTLDWLRQLVGLPEAFTATSRTPRRRARWPRSPWRARSRPAARVVVCSEHAHSSVDKACRLLELELRKVPVDDDFRLRPDALDLDDACAVVATIGTTSTVVDRSGAGDRRPLRRGRRLAARRRRLRGRGGRLPGAA